MNPFDAKNSDLDLKTLTLKNSSLSTKYCFLGECMGTESSYDLQAENQIPICRSKRAQRKAILRERDFPPPIPLLARTENQPSHMPWILRREYTSDGRLILIEEKVKHHEYFKAERSDGHLTLQLIHLDDKGLFPPFVCGDVDDEENREYRGDSEIIIGAEKEDINEINLKSKLVVE